MNKKLKSSALKILNGNWTSITGIFLLNFYISFVLSNILNDIFKQQIMLNPFIRFILILLNSTILAPFTYGIYKYSIDLKNGKKEIKTLFIFYLDIKLFLKAVVSNLLKYLYTFLKYMLFVIPGIVAFYEYALVEYLIIKEPKIKINGAIKQSREMMNNHKMELFSLHISFFGWYIFIFIIIVLIEIITTSILFFLGIGEELHGNIISNVIAITFVVPMSILSVYIRFSSIELFDKIYNKYTGVETIEEIIENSSEKDDSKLLIDGKKIICQQCNSKNGIKREYCWMCGKKL